MASRIVWDRQALRALRTSPEVAAEVGRTSDELAVLLALATPRDTGAGAASVEARPSRALGAEDVGWDKRHYYLSFVEFGTKHIEGRHFGRDVLDRYTHLE